MMINETSPRIIANHMTRVDIKLILGKSGWSKTISSATD
jgi:hypothetical protein